MRKFLFSVVLAMSLQASYAQASFREGYMSPQDLLMSLHQKFMGLTPMICSSISDSDLPALGDINPQTGEPMATAPGTAFISFWDKCIEIGYMSIVNHPQGSTDESRAEVERNSKIVLEVFIPFVYAPILSEIDRRAAIGKTDRRYAARNLVDFPQDLHMQKQLVALWTEWALGTDEEILSYGRMQSVDRFREDLRKHLVRSKLGQRKLGVVANEAFKILLKRDEFLSY